MIKKIFDSVVIVLFLTFSLGYVVGSYRGVTSEPEGFDRFLTSMVTIFSDEKKEGVLIRDWYFDANMTRNVSNRSK